MVFQRKHNVIMPDGGIYKQWTASLKYCGIKQTVDVG